MKLKSSFIYGLGILCLSACIASAQEGDRPKGPPQGGPGGQPGGGNPADRIAEFMKRADTDADGKISKEEFISMSKKETDDRFGKADANSDGFIDQAEFTSITQRMREGAAGSPGMRRPEGGGEGGFRRPPGGEGGPPSGAPGAPEGRRPEGGTQGGPPGGQGGRPGGGMFGDPKESFKRMDADANGSVSEAEYVAAMTKLREMMGNRGGQTGAPGGQGMRRPEGGGAPGGEGGGGFRRPPTEGDKPDAPKPEGDKPAPDKPKDAA